MKEFLSDAIERIGFAGLRVMNARCVPMDLIEPTLHVEPAELLSTYPADKTFSSVAEPCTLQCERSRQYRELELTPFRVASAYEPRGGFAGIYEALPENHDIRGIRVRFPMDAEERRSPPNEVGSAALVFCHGWAERSFGLELNLLFPALLGEAPGLDIYAMEEPYHMHRTPARTPYSGSFFFDNSPMGVVEAMRQAVSDASRLVTALKERYESVAVMGVSLGGHVCSYLATSDPRPDAFVLCQAGMNHPSLEFMLRLVPCLGRQVSCIDTAASFHAPLRMERFTPVADPERIITIHGAYDRLIPLESARGLQRHFGVRRPILYRGGHLSLGFQAKSISRALMPRLAALLG